MIRNLETRTAKLLLAATAWLGALASGAVLIVVGVFYMVFVRGFAGERGMGADIPVALLFLSVWVLLVTILTGFLIGPRRGRFSAGLRLALATIVGLGIGPALQPRAFLALATPSAMEAPRTDLLPFWFGLWCVLGLLGAMLGASWVGEKRGQK
jgi:hypothetical protein